MKPYSEFKQALATRESSDKPGLGNAPKIVNKWGFMGKYQFGAPRLSDLGVMKRNLLLVPKWIWCGGLTLERFLADEAFQDHVFDVHIRKLGSYLIEHIDEDVYGRWDLSGGIAASHLVGPGGFEGMLLGENVEDALGTKASEYYKNFSGYEIPFQALPAKVDLSLCR